MRKIDFQTKRVKDKNNYIATAIRIAIIFTVGKLGLLCSKIYWAELRQEKPDGLTNDICEFISLVICTILIGIIAYQTREDLHQSQCQADKRNWTYRWSQWFFAYTLLRFTSL